LPVEARRLEHPERAVLEIHDEVALPHGEVAEVLLDELALVAARDQEVGEAVARVQAHDVEEDRVAADLDHGLGTHDRLLRETRPQPAGQDPPLHRRSPDASATILGSGTGTIKRPPRRRYSRSCAAISVSRFHASRST